MRVSVVVGVLCTVLGSAAECKLAVHTHSEGVYTYGAGKKWKYIHKTGFCAFKWRTSFNSPAVHDVVCNFHMRRVLNLCNPYARHVHRRVQTACAVRGVGRECEKI